ncbi:MFS transporter [Streptomyces sp. NPDC050161]|uniref:MFS transporter n=1 Tax=Streptomyces sp. NPDC050161 TaxID=3365604 RepID=UPI0037B21809
MPRHTAVAHRGARHRKRSVVRGLYLARSADAAAGSVATYGIPMLVLATTDSLSLTGAAFALEWIPRLAAFAAVGSVVDRHGAATVFRLAALARMLVALAAAVALPALGGGLGTTVTVMALAAALGMLTQCSYIAAETQGADAARAAGDRGHRVQSVLLSIDQVALLAGPALGGLLLQRAGAAGMLTVLAAFSLLGALLTPRRTPSPKLVPVRVRAGLRVGWSTLRSLPALAWLVAGLALSNVTIGVLQAAAPVIVVARLGHSNASLGLVWSVAAGVTLVAVAVCRRAIDRVGLWPVGALCATTAACACLAVATAHTYGTYLVLTAVLMAGEGGLTVVLRTVRSHLIPAPVYASTLAVTVLLLLAPYPLAGALVALTPPDALGHAITACACLQTAGLAVAFARLRTRSLIPPGPTTVN